MQTSLIEIPLMIFQVEYYRWKWCHRLKLMSRVNFHKQNLTHFRLEWSSTSAVVDCYHFRFPNVPSHLLCGLPSGFLKPFKVYLVFLLNLGQIKEKQFYLTQIYNQSLQLLVFTNSSLPEIEITISVINSLAKLLNHIEIGKCLSNLLNTITKHFSFIK